MENEIETLLNKGNSILKFTEAEKVRDLIGINKFRKKIKREIAFLQTIPSKIHITDAYVKCSNLRHLETLIIKASEADECVALLHVFKYTDPIGKSPKKLVVDFVSHGGKRWNKVSARNPKALTTNSVDNNSIYGSRSIIDQANDYLECARENLHLFQIPEIVFHFASGIEASLAHIFKNMEVVVEGEIIDDGSGLLVESKPALPDNNESNTLNLDITTMLAYIASSTNGGCYAKISSPVLSLQLLSEQKHHVKKYLDELFDEKELVCCQTAFDSFKSILSTIAGPGEKIRGDELIERLKVVPDCPSEKALSLRAGGKVKHRSVVIFGTGDTLKIPTVTANVGFVRAAEHQNINFAVFTHESRSLTEAKEIRD
ncbi:hypothetical protein V9T40_004151 [Parthenolecanium corni]|uniref:DUF1308 domain-containing protein n=1 Tax=Parthenolecanium corni TaxID=536013 RepID=A0AAN9U337_9HEMI